MSHELDTGTFVNPAKNKGHGGPRYAPLAVCGIDSKIADVNQLVGHRPIGDGPDHLGSKHYQMVGIAKYLLERTGTVQGGAVQSRICYSVFKLDNSIGIVRGRLFKVAREETRPHERFTLSWSRRTRQSGSPRDPQRRAE